MRKVFVTSADPGGCAVWGVGLRPLACWDCGFKSRRGHGCLSLVIVVCSHVEVSAMGRSLVQKSLTECGVCECYLETSTVRRPRPARTVEPWKNIMFNESNRGVDIVQKTGGEVTYERANGEMFRVGLTGVKLAMQRIRSASQSLRETISSYILHRVWCKGRDVAPAI
jgi:hypothetical protein